MKRRDPHPDWYGNRSYTDPLAEAKAEIARLTAERDAAQAEVARLADLVSGLGYADPSTSPVFVQRDRALALLRRWRTQVREGATVHQWEAMIAEIDAFLGGKWMPGMCARCRSERLDATHLRWTCDNDRCGNYAGGIDPSFTLHPHYAEMFQERERGRQWAYVEMREERDRLQHDRDRALALLRKSRAAVQVLAEAVNGAYWRDLLAEIDALLKETP